VDIPHRNIRFTSTEDGVSIAYWEVGEGKPVILIQNWGLTHAELEWTVPSIRSFYEEMSKRYRLIRFDCRGIGLSEDPPGGWGLESSPGMQAGMSSHEMGLDIEAVAAALGLASFALMAVSVQGPVAIEYAATHDEVSELILAQAMVDVAASALTPSLQIQQQIMKVRGDSRDDMTAFFNDPWEIFAPEEDHQLLRKLVRASDDRVARSPNQPQFEWNANSYLSAVSVPCLILCSRNLPAGPAEGVLSDSRVLASAISGSQMRVIDGTLVPYFADQSAVLSAIDEFLSPYPVEAPGFRTVVFTDIVGSTGFVRRVGDEAGRAAIRDLEQTIAALAADHNGRVVKNLGDGSLVSFASNSSAIAFALDVQDQCSDGPLSLRIGMAAGEPILEDGDIHGTVVAHASRIGDLGDAGEVIVSDSVRQLAEGKGFAFESRGEVSLKGFDQPERVWRVTRP
jgi:class 3 adenylate cyclase